MAQLKSTIVQGALTVTSNVVANKLIKLGGTANQILMADGSVKSVEDLTKESDTLQTVTARGATTDKAITTAGLTTTSTLYVTGTTSHREGIRITPYGGLSSIW